MPGTIASFKIDLKKIDLFLSADSASTEITLNGEIKDTPIRIQLKSVDSDSITKADGRRLFNYTEIDIEITDNKNDLRSDNNPAGRAMYLLHFEYIPIVMEVFNRILMFFKYALRNPIHEFLTLSQILAIDDELHNPTWKSTNGDPILISDKPLKSGVQSTLLGATILNAESFGISLFKSQDVGRLTESVFQPQPISLPEQIISEAQGSALANNIRRSVLELAISIEVYVKNSFLKREKITGSAFEYLEDKGRESIRVLDLLDGASIYAFGESFKIKHKKDYTNIDHIFRCRNKIAHRGDIKFRDDTEWKEPDREMLNDWWNSTITMMNWLSHNINQAQSS